MRVVLHVRGIIQGDEWVIMQLPVHCEYGQDEKKRDPVHRAGLLDNSPIKDFRYRRIWLCLLQLRHLITGFAIALTIYSGWRDF